MINIPCLLTQYDSWCTLAATKRFKRWLDPTMVRRALLSQMRHVIGRHPKQLLVLDLFGGRKKPFERSKDDENLRKGLFSRPFGASHALNLAQVARSFLDEARMLPLAHLAISIPHWPFSTGWPRLQEAYGCAQSSSLRYSL